MQRIDVALIQRKIHEQGLWKVIGRILAELGRLVYHQRSCYIFRDDLDRPPPGDPGPRFEQLAGFKFRWLDLAREEDRGVMAGMMDRAEFDYTADDQQKRLENGDRAFVVFDRDQVVAYVWMCLGEREIYSGDKMTPGAGECFLYDGYTFQGYRGQRLLPAMLYHTRQDLAREGIARILVDIASTNASSIRAVEFSGFHRHLRITGHVLFGFLKFSSRKVIAADRGRKIPARAEG